MKCALCRNKECYDDKDCFDLRGKSMRSYTVQERESMRISAEIEAEYYMKKTRLDELIIYAKKMGYKRVGIAFCIGLENEARIIHEILAEHFEVYSACCKVCGIDKREFELRKLHAEKEREAMCNPIGQAILMNEKNTELNIILGLCIGHDILFTDHSNAPVTTLAVKDRVLAHNPLGMIYSGYYRRKMLGRSERHENHNCI